MGFFNIQSVAKLQKIEGGNLWGNFFPNKTSRNAEKTDPLVSSVLYVTRETFWFSFLGQQGQFEIFQNFRENYFGHFRCIEKTLTKNHEYSRLFSLEKRRLKKNLDGHELREDRKLFTVFSLSTRQKMLATPKSGYKKVDFN